MRDRTNRTTTATRRTIGDAANDVLSRCVTELVDETRSFIESTDDPMTTGSDCEGLIFAAHLRRMTAIANRYGYANADAVVDAVAVRTSTRWAHFNLLIH